VTHDREHELLERVLQNRLKLARPRRTTARAAPGDVLGRKER
jgi:hypothetical protein